MELIYAFCLCGFIGIGYGLYQLLYYNYALKKYKKIEGIIIDYTPEDSYNPETGGFDRSYRPHIKYEINGKTYRKDYYKGYGFENSARKNIGRKVVLYYDENDPYKTVFLGENGIACIIMGLLFLIIPVIVFFNK